MASYSKESIEKAKTWDEFLKLNGVNPSGWSAARKKVAEEQFKYLKEGIEVGEIDGYSGPQTALAKSIWDARQLSKQAEELVAKWRDNPSVNVESPLKPAQFKTVKWPNQAKWPKQNEAAMNKFFGTVGTNQVQAKIPFDMVIAWNTSQKIRQFSCHRLIKEPVERIFHRTLEHYGYEEIVKLRLHYFGGCLNVRKMRGGSSWSIHAWGCAIDLDPERNALNTPWNKAQFSKPEYDKFWNFVYDEGAISLGIERNFDAMHFQFANL